MIAEIDAAVALVTAQLEAHNAVTKRGGAAHPSPSVKDRDEASETWAHLSECRPEERRWLVEQCGEYQGWALAEHLCHESTRTAPKDAQISLDLARLAIFIAQRAMGSDRWRQRLLGYAHGYFANDLRVAGNLVAARKEMTRAWDLWRAGADPASLLQEWRLLDLDASLRRDARQFRASIDLLDRAALTAPASAMGRILVQRAVAQEQAGEPLAALASLEHAAPLVAQHGDGRLRWLLGAHAPAAAARSSAAALGR